MLKRLFILTASLAPFVAVAAIASAPTASADLVCGAGPVPPTPVCTYVCHTPKVVGRNLSTAKSLIVQHNCKVGTVTVKGKTHKKGFRFLRRSVTAQSPPGNGYYAYNTKVNLTVKYKFKKIRHRT